MTTILLCLLAATSVTTIGLAVQNTHLTNENTRLRERAMEDAKRRHPAYRAQEAQ